MSKSKAEGEMLAHENKMLAKFRKNRESGEFFLRFIKENDPVCGDFYNDIKDDGKFPHGKSDTEMINYLKTSTMCTEALEIRNNLIKEYQAL